MKITGYYSNSFIKVKFTNRNEENDVTASILVFNNTVKLYGYDIWIEMSLVNQKWLVLYG